MAPARSSNRQVATTVIDTNSSKPPAHSKIAVSSRADRLRRSAFCGGRLPENSGVSLETMCLDITGNRVNQYRAVL